MPEVKRYGGGRMYTVCRGDPEVGYEEVQSEQRMFVEVSRCGALIFTEEPGEGRGGLVVKVYAPGEWSWTARGED